MAKKKHALYKDPFVLILLAVVFSAAAVIFLRAGGPKSLFPEMWGIPQVVLGMETPDEMMNVLETTDKVWDSTEFSELKSQTKGL